MSTICDIYSYKTFYAFCKNFYIINFLLWLRILCVFRLLHNPQHTFKGYFYHENSDIFYGKYDILWYVLINFFHYFFCLKLIINVHLSVEFFQLVKRMKFTLDRFSFIYAVVKKVIWSKIFLFANWFREENMKLIQNISKIYFR